MSEHYYTGWALVPPEAGRLDAMSITKWPHRKGYVLTARVGNAEHPLAYFKSEEAAREAGAFLDAVAKARSAS